MDDSKKDPLVTDDLHHLKEGEIYTDPETGKKYRVRKAILPGYFSQGPHGRGDPDDRTLRRIEADVIIPNRMNARIEKVECNPSYLELVQCLRSDGAVKGLYSCKPELAVFNKCKYEKFHDTSYREMMTEEYMKERAEARRTGMTAHERELENFRQWKKQQEQNK